MRFCGNCGGQNREQARFCGHCGHPLAPPTTELSATPWVAEAERTEQRATGLTPRASFGAGVVVGITLLVLGRSLWPTAPAPPPMPVPVEDLVENRRAAAERYQAAEKLEERFAEAVQEQAKQLPTGLHELLFTQIIHNVRVDKLKRAERDLLVKYFTVQELEALARFYETAEGAAIQQKLNKVTEELQPLMMAEALHAVQETLREFQGPPSGKQSSQER